MSLAPDDPRHGTSAGYHAGCRGEYCRAAHRDYSREQKRKRRRALGFLPQAERDQAALDGWSAWIDERRDFLNDLVIVVPQTGD